MFKRFISYYKPHRLIFILDMLASLSVSVTGIFYPIVTRKMMNEFTGGTNNIKLIVYYGIILFGIYILRAALDFFIQYKGHDMGVLMEAKMRSDLFSHIETLPFSFFDNHETGKIMSRITSDLFDITELAHHGPENIIISSIAIIVSFIYLSTIDFRLTLVVFAGVPLQFIIFLALKRKRKNASRESRAALAEIYSDIESSVSGVRVTKAYTNAEEEKEKFKDGNGRFIKSRRLNFLYMSYFHSLTSFITNIFNVIVLVAGGIFLYRGNINVADYSAFIVSVGLFTSPVTTLVNFMEQFQDGSTGFERFCALMDEPSEKDRDGAVDIENVSGHIELCDVYSDYGDGKQVLSGVSLDIMPGKTYALVGPSGGGKTTICHLIPRFYGIKSGAVKLDGTDIEDITLKSLRKNIGIVQQDVFLFNASIKDNILYGKPDATDKEVIEAAKSANIHDFVMTLPRGYDTVIGERGVRLSGGQKQRLSIARVFLKNPPVLILDEATSALDNTTEILIQSALDRLSAGRTTVVVAHRLSTIKNADEIAVIEDGKITEKGTHKELVEKGGTYRELYLRQFKS